jgi:hypothetical protein
VNAPSFPSQQQQPVNAPSFQQQQQQEQQQQQRDQGGVGRIRAILSYQSHSQRLLGTTPHLFSRTSEELSRKVFVDDFEKKESLVFCQHLLELVVIHITRTTTTTS